MVWKLVIYVFCTVSANLILRYSGQFKTQYNLNVFGIQINSMTVLAVLCYGCGFIFLINLLQSNKLTFITPIMAVLVNGFIVLGAILIFKEIVTVTQIAGMILGVVAIILLII